MRLTCASAPLLLSVACSSTDIGDRTALAIGDGGPNAMAHDARTSEPQVMPEYDGTGALRKPTGWEQWTFLGSAVDLSYTSAAPPASDVLSAAYMEPTAFRSFKAAGEFREGTMTIVAAYATTSAGPPALGGTVPTDLVAFEMSVKDAERAPEGWAYYQFADGDTARASPRPDCFDCHDQHAETDHVFTQYYPALP